MLTVEQILSFQQYFPPGIIDKRQPVWIGKNCKAYICLYCGGRFVWHPVQSENANAEDCPQCGSTSICQLNPEEEDAEQTPGRLACNPEECELRTVLQGDPLSDGFEWL